MKSKFLNSKNKLKFNSMKRFEEVSIRVLVDNK